MKLTRGQQRVLAYAASIATTVLAGVLIKREWVDAASGAAIAAAGGALFGALREQVLPPPHRRKDDPKPEPQAKESD